MRKINSFPPLRSFISLFIALTTANFPDVMMPAYARLRFASVFFLIYMCFGLYFLQNLVLAVVYQSFNVREKEKFKRFVYFFLCFIFIFHFYFSPFPFFFSFFNVLYSPPTCRLFLHRRRALRFAYRASTDGEFQNMRPLFRKTINNKQTIIVNKFHFFFFCHTHTLHRTMRNVV